MSNFIDGIKQKAKDTKDAVVDVAQGIKDNMGHSHPKEGPMADDYKWMPDMMDLFTKGIRDNTSEVVNQIQKSFDFSDLIKMPEMNWESTAKLTDAEPVRQAGEFNITMNVYGSEGQDVRTLADLVSDRILHEINQTGAVYA